MRAGSTDARPAPKPDGGELFQLVDAAGNTIGQATRSACHGNPSLIHLVVHLHVFDAAGNLYLQKRSMSKDTSPGLWDSAVGGHVGAGEAVSDALLREAREELSIDAKGAEHLFGYLFTSKVETEYAHVFAIRWRGPIVPDTEEIEEGRFFPIPKIQALLGTGVLTPMFEHELPMLMAKAGSYSRQLPAGQD